MFRYGETSLGCRTLTPETTRISCSARATRCRSWSSPESAFLKNFTCRGNIVYLSRRQVGGLPVGQPAEALAGCSGRLGYVEAGAAERSPRVPSRPPPLAGG